MTPKEVGLKAGASFLSWFSNKFQNRSKPPLMVKSHASNPPCNAPWAFAVRLTRILNLSQLGSFFNVDGTGGSPIPVGELPSMCLAPTGRTHSSRRWGRTKAMKGRPIFPGRTAHRTPLQGWHPAGNPTQGGASLCPGLICHHPVGAKQICRRPEAKRRDGGPTLRVCFKTRPVGAPGLQKARIVTEFCRPRALTRRLAGVFKHALKWQMKRGRRVRF